MQTHFHWALLSALIVPISFIIAVVGNTYSRQFGDWMVGILLLTSLIISLCYVSFFAESGEKVEKVYEYLQGKLRQREREQLKREVQKKKEEGSMSS